MTAAGSKGSSSSAEIAQQLKTLLIELPEERADAARLDELRRLFAKLVSTGQLEFGKEQLLLLQQSESTSATAAAAAAAAAALKWNAHLQSCHKRMVTQLCQRIQEHKKTAVRTFWGVLATTPLTNGQGRQYLQPDLLCQFLRSLVQVKHMDDKALRHMVQAEFIQPYRDVQYYALGAIVRLANEMYNECKSNNEEEDDSKMEKEVGEKAERLFQLLLMIPIPKSEVEMDESNYLFSAATSVEEQDGGFDHTEEQEDEQEDTEAQSDQDSDYGSTSDEESSSNSEYESDSGNNESKQRNRQPTKQSKNHTFASFQQLRAHRKMLSKAWLAVLKLPIPPQALKHALHHLPLHVLSHVPNPLRFADFFMQAYSQSGILPLLALDGLFCLMTEHGLEYDKFYTSLYALLQPSMLYAKYRTRFLELLARCLCRNDMLPSHVVAAFCKRLVRCALQATPPGALFCLALCGNLLRQHEACACLIHRGSAGGNANGEKVVLLEDVFDAQTDDPTQARALESSLWELDALSKHYYPAVATLAKAVGGTQDLHTPLFQLDDFMSHTYKSLFDSERKRGDKLSRSSSSSRSDNVNHNKRRRLQQKATPLTFVEPESLIGKKDVFAGMLALPSE